LQLHGYSSIVRRLSAPEAVVTGASHSPSSNTTGNVTFRCQNDYDRDRLVDLIQREFKRLQESDDVQDAQKTEEQPAEPTEGPSKEIIPWNQGLSDMRNELADIKSATGNLSHLHHKIETLSARTTSTPDTNAPPPSDPSNSVNPPRSDLATRILLHLTADLKSRPGSYIGLDTNNIISALRADKQDVMTALRQLSAKHEIHNTLDENTWVVSHEPGDLPVLSDKEGRAIVGAGGEALRLDDEGIEGKGKGKGKGREKGHGEQKGLDGVFVGSVEDYELMRYDDDGDER
jgi:hypothetical protein